MPVKMGAMSSEHEVGADLAAWRESGSFVLDLDITSVLLSETRCLLCAPLTPAMSTASGAASLGLLVSLLDIAAAEPALAACRPDWTATQDLTVHATSRLVEGPVVVDAALVRVGKKAITTTANVYDGRGVHDFDALSRAIDSSLARPRARFDAARTEPAAASTRALGRASGESTAGPTLVARGLLTFARIPGSSATGMEDYDPGNWVGRVRRRTFERPPEGTLQARMGLQIVDAAAGAVELARTQYVTNTIGTIFGGAQAALLQAAAEAMRPGLEATDLQIHYLSQVKSGPARTIGRVSRDAADHSVVTLELRDVGYHDRLLALATVLLQRPPA